MCNGDSIAGLIKSIITTSKRHFIMVGVLSLLGKGILSHTLRIQGWSSLGQNKNQESAREVTRAHSPILPGGGGGVDCRGNEGLYLRLSIGPSCSFPVLYPVACSCFSISIKPILT